MSQQPKPIRTHMVDTEELKARLREAEETLEAIRSGDVDAVVVHGPNGQRVYTLENADRPYRILIEKMQEGAVTLTHDGFILYCNQALASILKTPAQRVIGSSFRQFVPEEQVGVFEQLLHEIGKGEILLTAGEGQTVQTHISLSELPDDDEGERIICGVVTDISQQKLRMQELAEKNQQLQKEIVERERTEESLRQAQKMEAVGQLTGGLAHDFNNLLTVILGNLQLIATRSNDERLLKYINSAIGATERGASLTQKLLAFSRRQALKSESILVNSLLPGVEMLAKQALGINIELHLRLSEELWYCRTDANQLESAILNLLINARDAMPQGGKVTIETANKTLDASQAAVLPDAVPGRYVVITVSDTGSGIPEELLQRVFEPFFTTKGIGKGSGLGLSMVYGFVRQTNGFINIESQVDQGTKVHLYLPYTPAPLTHLSGDGSERVVNTGVSATVLVVEDDLDVLKVVSELLTDMEYTVLTASNAPDALETIKQKADDIHLIFSDVVMPGGVSGIDMARELRNRHPHIPVLLTSGFVSQSTECNAQVDSEFEILRKPYSRSDLSDAIQKLLFHQHEANTRLSSLC